MNKNKDEKNVVPAQEGTTVTITEGEVKKVS